jgi:hypothetical protein
MKPWMNWLITAALLDERRVARELDMIYDAFQNFLRIARMRFSTSLEGKMPHV